MIQYEKLFKPFTEDGHTLEQAVKFFTTFAASKNISNDIMEVALNEVFGELAQGREFSKTKCHCGCGIDKAATDLIHTITDRMVTIDKKATVKVVDLLQKRHMVAIMSEIKRQSKADKKYAKANRPPISERSPVLRMVRKLWQ